MENEQKVCTIDQAKQLKALGVEQKSDWYWVYPEKPTMISTTYGVYHKSVAFDLIADNEGDEFDSEMSSAFDVPELLDLLPYPYSLDKRFGDIGLSLSDSPIYYMLAIKDGDTFYSNTAASVIAEALIDNLTR